MVSEEIEEARERFNERLLTETETWTHHVADLHGSEAVRTFHSERPPGLKDRLGRVADFVDGKIPVQIFDTFQRRLSPRQPYELSPLSYLVAYPTWWLSAERDTLAWSWHPNDPRGRGVIDFSFRDVAPGKTYVVTIMVRAAAEPRQTGNLEVRATGASTRTFQISGDAEHTLDLIVRPGRADSVVVTLSAKDGVFWLLFRAITVQVL